MNKKFSFVLLFFFCFICNSLLFSQIKPNQLGSLKLWLKADSGVVLSGSNVTQWNDVSNNGNDFLQADTVSQPVLITSAPAINNLPSIYFDGGNYLSGGDILDLENFDITVVCLIKINSGSNPTFFAKSNYTGSPGHYGFAILGGSLGLYYDPYTTGSAPPDNAYYLCSVMLFRSTGTTTVRINGSIFCTANYSPESTYWNNTLPFCVGSNSNGGFKLNGEITELAYFISALNTSEVTGLETYFVNKYFPPVNLGADIHKTNFCDTLLDAGSRYTSFLWSTTETTQSISVSQPGTYWVSVTDAMGFSSSDTINITYPAINLNDTIFCSGNSVTLSTGLTGTYSYNWSSGPTTPTIDVNTAGNYSVTVTDGSSCTAASTVIVVSEDTFPLTASLGSDTSICSGNSIGLLAPLPLPPGLTYVWSTFENTPQITITDSGNYSVTVTDPLNCIALDTIHVTIGGTAPDADFNYIPGCSGTSSTFNNASLPSGDSWLWDFGDGQTDTAQNPTHIYATKGTYTVSLTVSDSYCSNTILKSIYISGTPTAAFSADTACANHAYNFTDQSSSNDGTIVSWDWGFGDASMHSLLQNPQHTYTAAGSYNVTLTVTTDSSCQSTEQHAIIVVTSASAPGPFTLYQPVNNYFSSNALIDFGWNSSAGAVSYALEYSTDSFLITNVYTVSNILTTTYQITLPSVQTYYWRVIAANICGNQMSSEIRKVILFSPAFYTSMQLWLKADSGVVLNGNNVAQWTDQSNKGNNLLQGVSSAQPLRTSNNLSLNNMPSVYFDGNDNLNGGDILDLENHDITAICLIRSNTNTTTTYFAKSDYSGTPGHYALAAFGSDFGFYYTPYAAGQTPPDSSYFFCTVLLNRSNGLTRLRKNGILYSAVNYTPESTSWNNTIPFCLGSNSNGNYNLNGEITELLYYDTALSNNQISNIESYLIYKYAPPVNLGPDLSIPYGFCDTTLSAGPRFTHYLWSTGDTTESIAVNSGGTYAVQVMDIFGFTSTDTVIVNKPVALHVSDTMGCLGTPILMSAGLGTYYNYSWSTGDTTESITLSLPGDYWLEITDTLACSIRDTVRFAVDSFAVKATLGPDKSACRGEILGLLQGQNEAVGYAWSTGSGNAQILLNNAPQTYQDYSVTVNNALGCLAKDTIRIFVRGDVPLPAFLSDSVCPGQFTSFTDLSSAIPPELPESWLWAFGDGDSSALQHPTHSYASSGQYTVSLTVVTDSGCFKTISKPVTVWGTPNVAFSPVNGCNGVPVPFHDYSTNDHGTNTGWHWDFGETVPNDTSLLQHPSWTYAAPGTYTVSLIVSSNGGCIDTLQRTIDVREAPEPGFTVSQSCDGQRIFFVDTTQTHPWTETTYRKWYFGDGDSSTLVSPSHVYNTVGTYNVTLVVKSLNGCSNSITAPIAVHPVPVAGIWNTNLCATLPGQLLDSTVLTGDAIESWHWTINGLITSTQQNPMFTPATAGPVTAQLIVKSTSGCSDTTTKTLMAYPLPNAAFSYDPEFGTAPLTVNFTNLSTGDASWLWDFGDSGSSTSENPEYVFFTEGIYPVTLTVISIYGCPHSVTQDMFVIMLITDIAVVSAETVTSAATLGMQATLLNNGTRAIGSLIMKARFNGSNTISEIWNGVLAPGEMLDYQFNASFELMSGQKLDYACVEAEINGYADDRPENNLRCEVLNDIFSVSKPYPNPVSGEVALDVILPFADDVFIAVYNEAGKKVAEVFSGPAPEGYARYIFDASALQAGTYAIHVAFRDKKEVRKFVRL